MSKKLAFSSILLTSLLLRLAPLIRPGINWATTSDSIGYIDLACGFVAGCGFARTGSGHCLQAELIRTPGYPLFLAVLPSLRAALAVQAILGSAVVTIVALFAWRWIGVIGAFIVALILGLDVPSIVASNSLLTETLFTAMVTGANVLQLEAILRDSIDTKTIACVFTAGLLFGLATLVRPIGEVLIVVAALPAFVLRGLLPSRRITLALLSISVPLVVIVGWSYRNWDRRGIWTLSTIGALNSYFYRAAGILAYESGESVDNVQSELLQSAGNSIEELSPAMTRDLSRRGRAIMRSDPRAFCIVTLKGFMKAAFSIDRTGPRILCGYEAPPRKPNLKTREKISPILSFPLLSLILLIDYCILAFTWTGAGLALWSLRDSKSPLYALIVIPLLTALFLLAAAAGPEGYDRFRVPAMPMLAMLAALGWTRSQIPNVEQSHGVEGKGNPDLVD